MSADPTTPRTADEERFHGMMGAWDDPRPLPDTIRRFADSVESRWGHQFAGWTELWRAWAHRIEAEAAAPAASGHAALVASGLHECADDCKQTAEETSHDS